MESKADELNGALVSGAEAAAHVAYGLSDLVLVQPQLDVEGSAGLAPIALQWQARERRNCFDKVPQVLQLERSECTGAQLLAHLETAEGQVVGGVLSGSGAVLKMLPNLHALAAQKLPCVLHVAAQRLNTSGTDVESDFSDIAALRDSGAALLAASSTREVHDMGVIAHVAAAKAGTPVVSFFDGARLSSQLERVKMAPYGALPELVAAGVATGSVADAFDNAMQACAETLGKRYQFFEYEGPEDAEAVVVALGSPAQSLLEAVRFQVADKKRSDKCRVGVVRVRMLRPWSPQHLLAALPKTTRRVCVLDQNRSGEDDTPLFKDVAAAFHSDAQWTTPVLLSGNLVLSSKLGFTPALCKAVLDNLLAAQPKARFTLSDLGVERPLSGAVTQTSDLVCQAISWSIGERAAEARSALAVVLGPFLNLEVQQNDSSSLKTSVARTDLRFAPFPIASEYPVLAADVVSCDDAGVLLLPHCDVLANAKEGATLLINASWSTAEEADLELSSAVKARLAQLGAKLVAIDATKLARGHSNWVMQAVLLKCFTTRFVDLRQAYRHLARLISANVPHAAEFVAELADGTVGNHMREIAYPADKWAALASAEAEAEDTAPAVPLDMLPAGMMQPRAMAADASAASPALPLYHNLLNQLFGERLVVADTTGAPLPAALEGSAAQVSASLESCYGAYVVKSQARQRLIDFVQRTISSNSADSLCSKELLATLGMWHGVHDNAVRCSKVVPRLVDLLAAEKHKGASLEYIFNNRKLLHKSSKWVLGGDNWAYDLSNSGIRHIIASGQNINVVVFDSEAYEAAKQAAEDLKQEQHEEQAPSADLNSSAMSILTAGSAGAAAPPSAPGVDRTQKRKKDIGLYAMNYGTAYVASVSVLASQSQALRALAEADAFEGPSIILAHAPRVTAMLAEQALNASSILSEPASADPAGVAHAAVESGAWPLYRWNPALEKDEFTLDSSKLKAEIEEFVKREQNLSLLARSKPTFPVAVSHSLEAKRVEQDADLRARAEQRRLNEQFDQLVDGVGGNKDLGLVVLYGSDGGNASGVAEKLAKKAEVSGCGEVRCMEANDFSVDNLAEEKHLLLVLATAGQGEPCANAKGFTETLLGYGAKLPGLKYAVLGLGDSHYWGEGTADSARYFCLNAREVDERLAELGAERILPVGLGDDQHDDGYDGALSEWEPQLWDSLGVKIKQGNIGGPPAIVDDDIKIKSNFLRGMIDEGLADMSTGKLLPEDTKLTKFHGIYQQDLRSVREELDAKGLERAYSFMIRIGVPGGVATTEQYVAMDELCTKYANGALKLTTRQAYQFHGVLKGNLKTTMKGINRACMDTLAACGDVNRNVIANPHHRNSGVHKEVHRLATALQAHLRPKTSAYAEIWLDKKPVGGSVDHEPIYGTTYLPRKFKIAIAVPPLNDVDVFAHCLGFIAIAKGGRLVGFNVCVGGGMGTTHGNKATYPRLSDIMGFCTPEQAVAVAEATVKVQRDNGDRDNRKHARLKYTVEDMGMSTFRAKVEELCGFRLGEGQPFKFDTNADPYGWHQSPDGMWQYTMFVENGYIKDREDYKLKTGLREIAEFHTGGEMSLTATQNIIIGAVSPERKPQIEALMQKYHIDNNRYSAMRLHSMACVALPTCALAMAESQTYLPSLIDKIEVILDQCGLRHDAITIRMTGCPNGCGRPALAEIGFIGKAPGQYNMYLGAGFAGNRISKMYREGVNETQILEILGPMLHDYATTRQDGEHFGDFCLRKGIIEPTLHGRCFWSHGKENDLSTPSGTTQIYW